MLIRNFFLKILIILISCAKEEVNYKPKEKVMKEYYETPKGRAQDNPKVKTPPRPRIPQPATPKAQVAPKVVKPVESAKTQANEKSGIDAALDGIE